MKNDQFTIEVAQEFQRRMAGIINTVQTGIWQNGVEDLLGYATDYAFGQKRGQQTLVLKTGTRSAYLRLQWDTIMGDSPDDKELLDGAINGAINELV
ncbi:MAG: hypothetical protein V4568_12565 [Pseudomonadota bacterium]